MGENERVRLDRMKSDKEIKALERIAKALVKNIRNTERQELIDDVIKNDDVKTLLDYMAQKTLIPTFNNLDNFYRCAKCENQLHGHENYCDECGVEIDWYSNDEIH